VAAGPDRAARLALRVTVALPADLARSVELLVGLIPELQEDITAFVERAVRERLSRMIGGISPIPRARGNVPAPAPRVQAAPKVRAPRRERQERAAQMYERYREGATLREIGEAYDLTRERVRHSARSRVSGAEP
jgi:hypothetical protein